MANAPERTAIAAHQPTTPTGQDDFGVLIGWSHTPISRGIRLMVQSTTAERDRKRGDIAARSYLMTRNQALILARYLLDVTGQTLPPPRREGRLKRLWRRLTRH